MKELSIFIDESGDFGAYDYHSPFYIVTMVLHDQSNDISDKIDSLEFELKNLGYPNHCLHTGPIIRREYEFSDEDIVVRRRILSKLMGFVRRSGISYKCFYIEKKHVEDITEAAGKLSKQMGNWIRANYSELLSYDIIKIYYDKGQKELSKILSSVFNALFQNIETRKVIPADYRLFQVADFISTMKLLELKADNHTLSTSELIFFSGEDNLRKSYLKDLIKYEKKLI